MKNDDKIQELLNAPKEVKTAFLEYAGSRDMQNVIERSIQQRYKDFPGLALIISEMCQLERTIANAEHAFTRGGYTFADALVYWRHCQELTIKKEGV